MSLNRLDAARRNLREERRRCVDEREAFRAFQKDVSGLKATAPTPRTPPAIGHRQTTDSALTRVRRAYERTVMSVPHYDVEYGDSFEDSVSAEFGPDVATAFQSASVFSPALRHTVVSAAAAAVDERTEFVRVVDEESESIESMRDEIAAIVGRLSDLDDALHSTCGFDELLTLYSEISDFQDRLSTLVEQRQKTITNHRRALSSWVPDVTEFFYEDLPTRYPVLATLADVGGELDTVTRRVERQLASAP
ncbi:hypothetical protein C439_05710 [Haloferax mediterranei ATCC 33500]|uniref:DUF7260 domain-containing protein n=1 Tax=Haloferax mediterranei (strain ATCC 33500 / DSM 1411 / JCM 8866 / NBRC 14739 / NCIMB 2177 / R-4) TaxID=523841 RepID=M0J6Y7_HALMT|nr:hypothetical protein [Haloferax mediterranei]EMA03470.1 hypothetical protein C439_05710 [Haloferax mediterranei ATCC 33500]MDX5988766.1 hypothetical protein [Haloferax mediterranei ATCC 33500]